MNAPIIKVNNLSKRYRIGLKARGYKTCREAVVETVTAPMRNFRQLRRLTRYGSQGKKENDVVWALENLTFEVQPGEVLGIIGRNGAGKSTLLKILSRITEPTAGEAKIYGRVSSLLEVGTGFHPELTGRENIYLNGAILGMRKEEIRRKFDDIVGFAEIETFLDTPVKRYSSGMYVRLAFAVAAHLEPEVLLVDEVLAVGDIAFQRKCLGKMGNVANEGRTILFVSHNMAAVENLCKKTMLVDSGRIVQISETRSAISRYLDEILPTTLSSCLSKRNDRSGTGKVRLTSFHMEDTAGKRLSALRTGEDAVFVFGYSAAEGEKLKQVSVGFGVFANDGKLLFVLYSSYTGQDFNEIPRLGYFRCRMSRIQLVAGRYRIGARVTVGGEVADWPNGGISYIDVERGDFYGTGNYGFEGQGSFFVDGSWEVE